VPNVKFIPKNIEQVREVLIDFPADLEIELEIGVPLDAKTVEDLRLLYLAARLGLGCGIERAFLCRSGLSAPDHRRLTIECARRIPISPSCLSCRRNRQAGYDSAEE